jgi:enterochelin esterase-like enzyme
VTFVWQAKADTRSVAVVDGVAGFDPTANQMNRLGTTDVWYKTYVVRKDARFIYHFSLNDLQQRFEKLDPKDIAGWIKLVSTLEPDPYNPHRFDWRLMRTSYVELSEAPPQSWIVPLDQAPKGVVEQKKLRSEIQNNERTVWVYTPHGFAATAERYPLLVIFDGEDHLKTIPLAVILDNLIAKKAIPPMVAIMLDAPGFSRFTDLPCSAPFSDFVAREAVPWRRDNYHATCESARTVVAGQSFGGLAATYAALRHPEVFGNVLSQSGSFWWSPDEDQESEWLARQFVASPKLPVRFFVEVGLMEIGPTPHDGPSQVVVSRHMRDVLAARGYAVSYHEFNGGHSYLNWRGSLADGLIFLTQ